MTYEFARIDLNQTDYTATAEWAYLVPTEEHIAQLKDIYQQYCKYKKFKSVMPLFTGKLTDPMTDIIGYYDCQELVAFSLVKRYDNRNAECLQFAWTYHDPKLRLGIETMKTECAIYKDRGFDYLYLEQAQEYKKEITGFEILGPLE